MVKYVLQIVTVSIRNVHSSMQRLFDMNALLLLVLMVSGMEKNLT